MQETRRSHTITVKCTDREVHFGGQVWPCAIGKNGYVPFDQGREGDGQTPLGIYPLRYGYYRAGRIETPDSALAFYPVRPDDGWCDDVGDPAYNRPVRLPYPASTESLWRDSHVYDVIVVLGHNDNPPTPPLGSAIFLHVAREGYGPTQGCVAMTKDDLLSLLRQIPPHAMLNIQP